jgi:hypothetical protein
MRDTVKTFGLLVVAAFLGAVLSQGLHVLVKPEEEPEPVVKEGFDPAVIEPKMGQR